MPGGVRFGVRGRTGRGLPSGKVAFGGKGLGGLVCMWLGLLLARYLAPSLLSAAAVAVPGEARRVRAGHVLRASGVPGTVSCLGRSGSRSP